MRLNIALLGLVILASGCIDNSQTDTIEPDTTDQTSMPTELSNSSGQNIIYLTESGFQPEDLTIQQGETVTWINNASSSMWVASDEHTTHRNYAGSTIYQHCQRGDQTEAAFDQCSSGEEFSFAFEKTGEWDYHHHERPVQGGTITVE